MTKADMDKVIWGVALAVGLMIYGIATVFA